jgi:hypothetical protein
MNMNKMHFTLLSAQWRVLSLQHEVRCIPLQHALLYRSCSNTCFQQPLCNLLRCVQIWKVDFGRELKLLIQSSLSNFGAEENLPATIEASTILVFVFQNILSHLARSFFISASTWDVTLHTAFVTNLRTIPHWPTQSPGACFFGCSLGFLYWLLRHDGWFRRWH